MSQVDKLGFSWDIDKDIKWWLDMRKYVLLIIEGISFWVRW